MTSDGTGQKSLRQQSTDHSQKTFAVRPRTLTGKRSRRRRNRKTSPKFLRYAQS